MPVVSLHEELSRDKTATQSGRPLVKTMRNSPEITFVQILPLKHSQMWDAKHRSILEARRRQQDNPTKKNDANIRKGRLRCAGINAANTQLAEKPWRGEVNTPTALASHQKPVSSQHQNLVTDKTCQTFCCSLEKASQATFQAQDSATQTRLGAPKSCAESIKEGWHFCEDQHPNISRLPSQIAIKSQTDLIKKLLHDLPDPSDSKVS
eukprot:Filipodium_phascolosomae@DN162_c0_g1_i2.p1